MSAQEDFDKKYITSSEIRAELGVQRTALIWAQQKGILPQPIKLYNNQIFLWEREVVKENLAKWKSSIQSRRGISA